MYYKYIFIICKGHNNVFWVDIFQRENVICVKLTLHTSEVFLRQLYSFPEVVVNALKDSPPLKFQSMVM